jgi:RNA polymerase sigma-70 factor (ECF subfamily)
MRPELPTSRVSDRFLWEQALAGQPAAFGQLFDRHFGAVYDHCVRRTGVVQDAEEIASWSFLEAWRRPAKVRFVDDSLRPWLLVVATNLSLNRNRARRRYRAALARLPAEGELDATDLAQQVVDTASALDLAKSCARLVADLPRAHQEVVSLCDLSGLTHEEAAAALGVPVGTVKSRLSRAHRSLRANLDALDRLRALGTSTPTFGGRTR